MTTTRPRPDRQNARDRLHESVSEAPGHVLQRRRFGGTGVAAEPQDAPGIDVQGVG